jgi:hypothetical protein
LTVSCETVEGRDDEETCADLCQAALAAEGDGILDNRSASEGKVEGVREGGSDAAIMSHAEGVRSTRDASNYGLRSEPREGMFRGNTLVRVVCIVGIRKPWRLTATLVAGHPITRHPRMSIIASHVHSAYWEPG